MSAHRPSPLPYEPDEMGLDAPIIRLADHAIGLWQAAEDVGDPALLDALRPLVVRVARSLARNLIEEAGDETAH